LRNNLDGETSPYLLQHRDNPVHWQPWGPAALKQARAEDKPVLLSVGYAACHWCHVMAHESFENDDVAAVMNELFVNIKVDREERPDLDAIYQSALMLLGQQGGWPLTMFLTPDGQPFWGGTYFPSEAKYGRPGFPDVLRRVAEVYRQDPDAIAKNTGTLMQALAQMATPAPAEGRLEPSPALLDQIAGRIAREVDPVHGGIGTAPKFPQPYAFELLLRAWLRTGDETLRRAVDNTLRRMCQGGIYDHLGGGFARYSTDEKWLAPHFEKMLYDNAQLIGLLTLAWQATGEPLYAERVRESVGWLLREMIAAGGGFAATLDADSEGVEGKFYVWSYDDVCALLGEDAALFCRVYDVSPGGNWENTNIINRIDHPERLSGEDEARLATCRARLFAARAPRVRPGWDDKVLADWNGMTIAALTRAAAAFGEPAWQDAAVTAFDFVRTQMGDGANLHHSHRAGRSQHDGMLEDYAQMANAALELHQHTGEARFLAQARQWAETIEQRFLDQVHGGYFQSARDAGDLIARMKPSADNAVPSGNGMTAQLLVRLWLLTGEPDYRLRADALFDAFTGELARNFFPMTTFLNALDLMMQPVQVVIIGERAAPAVQAMLAAVHRACLPNLVLQVLAPGDSLPDGHPAAGKPAGAGPATAYVCVGQTCSLPVGDADGLAAALPQPPDRRAR
jgi:uncharacterized protein YyaL (SSP411 family)